MRRSSSRPGRPGIAAVLAAAATVAACGGATQSVPDPFRSVGAVPDDGASQAWSPDEIVRAEILSRGQNYLTAMALVRRLRPAWLRARGAKSFNDSGAMYPVVYIDEIRHGGLETLHGIPTSEILSMRFFSMADATTRWGTGHPSGVINVETGRF